MRAKNVACDKAVKRPDFYAVLRSSAGSGVRQILVLTPKRVYGNIGKRKKRDAPALIAELMAHMCKSPNRSERLAAAGTRNHGHWRDRRSNDLLLLGGRLRHGSLCSAFLT